MKNETIICKIIAYAEKILQYCNGVDAQSELLRNPMLVEACVFNLGQIGELAHKMDDGFVTKYPDIPWRALYGLRNRIVHDYEGINLNLIWDVIKYDLPDLVAKLKNIPLD